MPASPDERPTDRLTNVEMLATHIERTMQSLDETVRAQQKQIDALERRLEMLGRDLGTLREEGAEPRKPEDEKPPHY